MFDAWFQASQGWAPFVIVAALLALILLAILLIWFVRSRGARRRSGDVVKRHKRVGSRKVDTVPPPGSPSRPPMPAPTQGEAIPQAAPPAAPELERRRVTVAPPPDMPPSAPAPSDVRPAVAAAAAAAAAAGAAAAAATRANVPERDETPMPSRDTDTGPAAEAGPPVAQSGAAATTSASEATIGEDMGTYVAVTAHYGSDRRDMGETADPGARFSYERADVTNGKPPVSYGTVTVSIPHSHVVGGLEDRTWFQYVTFQARTPDQAVMVTRVTPQSKDAFFSTLNVAAQRSSKNDAFIFVHGFSVTFADAARRTAQMAYDLNFRGAPIFFTWPTPGLLNSPLTAYTTSEANADLSKYRFRDFLRDVLEKCDATTVHLIAHSMGNRLVTEALLMLDTVLGEQQKAKLGEVILTAPDIDATTFIEEIAPRIAKLTSRATLYASSKDEALAWSKKVHAEPRIGEFDLITTLPIGLEVIDASSCYDPSDGIGHSYYGGSEPVIGDLCYLINLGLRASQRQLTLTAINGPGGTCWSVLKAPLSAIYAAINSALTTAGQAATGST